MHRVPLNFSSSEHIHFSYLKIFGFWAPWQNPPILDHSVLALWSLARHQNLQNTIAITLAAFVCWADFFTQYWVLSSNLKSERLHDNY